MFSNTIIIVLCVLLLLAYLFDISASKTKIPSVILLLLSGWLIRKIVDLIGITVPDLDSVLPILGTIGLILIVLEGSLELNFNKSKLKLINKAFVMALLPILLFGICFTLLLSTSYDIPFKTGFVNAIPLSVISSAIAIPTSRLLMENDREFIIYESSFSDIIGVLLFNFLVYNDIIGISTFVSFSFEILIMLVISLLATVLLLFLLNHINLHVKFIPLILIIILIYSIAKHFHLPALIFILIFGLILGNIDKLKGSFIKKIEPLFIEIEIIKFKELGTELTFLVRSMFFLLFGFLIETKDIINKESLLISFVILIIIYSIRVVLLKLFKLKIKPFLFFAPRGLITILLFLSIPEKYDVSVINKSLIIQVIIFSALFMMFGLFTNKKTR